MKHLFLFFTFIALQFSSFAQDSDPVTWKASYQATSANEGIVVIQANIQNKWHTYSQKPTADGPIPTSFTFTPSPSYTLVGPTEESPAHEEFVPAFGAKIFVYTDKAEFRQKVKLKSNPGFIIKLSLEYMSCNDLMCLPPKIVDLSVKAQ